MSSRGAAEEVEESIPMETEDEKKGAANNEALMKVRFENYNPRTEDLQKYCVERVDAGQLLHEVMANQEELIKNTNRKFGDPALDLDNLVPRKGNWDIKRSLAPKLARLEQRTQRAVIRMAREKARKEKVLDAPPVPEVSSDESEE